MLRLSQCLFHGIKAVKAGENIREIGRAIQRHADKHGYSLVREYSGHGIGRAFHEGPRILHYDTDEIDTVLKEGMAITIEPMLNAGGREVLALEDQWTIVTKDGSSSAQWEHTVVVTETGAEVLTIREGENWPESVLEST